MADTKRVEVGFIGNQVITLKVDEDQLKDLRKHLSEGGWRSITTEDGEVEIDLAKVAFVRVAGSGHGVGFSSAS
jgi:hypothetical protein